MKTAVQWLDRWFRDNPEATHEEGNKALEQAKKMEKEQIINALEYGWDNGHIHISILEDVEEKYYTSTYGSKGSDVPNGKKVLSALKDFRDSLTEEEKETMFKGSDDHIVDTNEMIEDTFKVWECCGMEECICKGSDETKQ